MPETGTSGSMSGDGKRGVGHRPQVTAPILDFTETQLQRRPRFDRDRAESRHEADIARRPSLTHLGSGVCVAALVTMLILTLMAFLNLRVARF